MRSEPQIHQSPEPYPLGSVGRAFDDLEAALTELAASPGLRAWPLRAWARSRRRKLAASRERMRSRALAALREGWLS